MCQSKANYEKFKVKDFQSNSTDILKVIETLWHRKLIYNNKALQFYEREFTNYLVYTCGRFILIFGKTNTIMYRLKIK